MTDRTRVVSIGECMVELARHADGRYGLAYGGDTFNTAIYLARLGQDVAYAAALGDDPYSHSIRDMAAGEGIATDLITMVPGRMPGLYLIETAGNGERTFHYWRDRSPARELPDSDAGPAVFTAIREARLVYLSGITLSLYSATGLDTLADALAAARDGGAIVAMDANYRPRGWGGDGDRARRVMERFWRLASLALPTFDDEVALWGDATPSATIERLGGLGIGEIIVKCGAEGALSHHEGRQTHVPIPRRVMPVDTTAAGDSFNAAYVWARLTGQDATAAARAGHTLAGVVIQHRGAIVPKDAMPALT